MLFHAPSDVDQLMAGFTCHLFATRLRFKDAMRAVKEPSLDVTPQGFGYIEQDITDTKTTSVPMSKRTLKTALGHALGLSGVRWAEAWVAKRKAMGLDAHTDRCLLPAIDPADNSKFMKRRLRSHEYVRWLKGFLSKSRMWSPGAQELGSHSAKATLLSWSAKYGLDFGTRRALGYHVPLKNRVVQVYSRDYQAAPMRKLELVDSAVSDGEFRPDLPRSDMCKKRRREEALKGQDPDEVRSSWPICT